MEYRLPLTHQDFPSEPDLEWRRGPSCCFTISAPPWSRTDVSSFLPLYDSASHFQPRIQVIENTNSYNSLVLWRNLGLSQSGGTTRAVTRCGYEGVTCVWLLSVCDSCKQFPENMHVPMQACACERTGMWMTVPVAPSPGLQICGPRNLLLIQ